MAVLSLLASLAFFRRVSALDDLLVSDVRAADRRVGSSVALWAAFQSADRTAGVAMLVFAATGVAGAVMVQQLTKRQEQATGQGGTASPAAAPPWQPGPPGGYPPPPAPYAPPPPAPPPPAPYAPPPPAPPRPAPRPAP